MRSLVVVVLALLVAAPAASQDSPAIFDLARVGKVRVDDVHPGPHGDRVVDVYLRALTRHGDPVEGLDAADVALRQDGEVEGGLSIESLRASKRGVTAVLAIDVSRTMEGEPITRAREAALNFLERLGSHDRVAIVAFGNTAETVVPFTASRGEAKVRLEALEHDDNALRTVLYDGVHQALDLIRTGKDLPRRSLVIVFSDGEDGGSARSLDEVIQLADAGHGDPRVLVFTIGYPRFGKGGLDVLRQLASGTGADFMQVRSEASLQSLDGFYNDVWHQMMQSYVVSFGTSMDGEAHTVAVSIGAGEDERSATYPSYPLPLWPFALGGLLLLLLLAVFLVLRRRAPGRIAILSGTRKGQEVSLRPGRMRIGAIEDNDIVIPSAVVSRYHAELHVKGKRVELQDRSANGTQVNGNDVQTHVLEPGDRILIAKEVELEYRR